MKTTGGPEDAYWRNVLATHRMGAATFSKVANLFTWSLVLAYIYVQRAYAAQVGIFYWTMIVSAMVIALVHTHISGQDVLTLEGARLRDSAPQLVVAVVAFLVIYLSPVVLGRTPAKPSADDALFYTIASLGESLQFAYVMPQVVPMGIVTSSVAFALSHGLVVTAFATGTMTWAVVAFAVVAACFNAAMILILASRTWLKGVSRWNLWRGGGLWVVVAIHLAVNLAIFSYGYLFGVIW